ncbi:MAG TPA: GNAT family N-acetyltransferase [Pseudonocardiaceae bacterium]|jgi:predicted GNAT family acetyltransferase|nr:GNAT family N-acetyltransferase [Pseudonocardiaceae bacterium]
MPWEVTDDVEVYAERAWPLLAARPAENTIALTVIETVRAAYGWSDETMVFGWYDDGRVSGAVSMISPYELLLAVMPHGSVDELAAELRAREVFVPGVHGEVGVVERFAAAWIAGTSWRAVTTLHLRLYALSALRPLPVPPAGRARRACGEDFGIAVRWLTAFHGETGGPAVDLEAVVRNLTDNGLLWVWEDSTGAVVSLAGRKATAAGVARVAPVYTPPENRRCGYGAAVTTACTSDALRCGAQQVVLFTDLANPTSNSIYQQIGYRPISDRTIVRFRQ